MKEPEVAFIGSFLHSKINLRMTNLILSNLYIKTEKNNRILVFFSKRLTFLQKSKPRNVRCRMAPRSFRGEGTGEIDGRLVGGHRRIEVLQERLQQADGHHQH